MFTKVMRCVKCTTTLVNKMIAIICCTHCDCMLPFRKTFVCYLPVRWCKMVENHWFKTPGAVADYISDLSWCGI